MLNLSPNAKDFPTLCGPGSAFHKFGNLSLAFMEQHAVQYNLQPSILLAGARGIGKFTTIQIVARSLGMHIMEVCPCYCHLPVQVLIVKVNCYDLLGDTEVQTEGLLRSKFEKACDSSPCIIVLRYLEAFSQTTQGGNEGKGTSLLHR